MKLDVIKLDGAAAGSIDLGDDIFGLEPRVDLGRLPPDLATLGPSLAANAVGLLGAGAPVFLVPLAELEDLVALDRGVTGL